MLWFWQGIHLRSKKLLMWSMHRGVIYQTKGKGLLYTSVQLDRAFWGVKHDLTIRDHNPQMQCYSSRVDISGLNLVHQIVHQIVQKNPRKIRFSKGGFARDSNFLFLKFIN
jgi:hypothetical protein